MAGGRKGAITIVIVAGLFAGFFAGKIPLADLRESITWALGLFVGGTAIEDAAKHLASRPTAPAVGAVVAQASTPSEERDPLVET